MRGISSLVERLGRKLPKFEDGRIDYSKSKVAVVLTIFIRHTGRILLLKRSSRVSSYKNRWNVVAGFLDDLKPLREKVLEELKEELGLRESSISCMHFGRQYRFRDREIDKTWIVFPVLVDLKEKPVIKLDWEHVEYKWVLPEELKDFGTVPNLEKSWKNALKDNGC
ncbi:MAG: NUDIX domain-containing protein [Candidatus Altiarchaeales archaeon]|nr:NUDIX domain-containing protein [Candidatus Altiarchaeales archaeon]